MQHEMPFKKKKKEEKKPEFYHEIQQLFLLRARTTVGEKAYHITFQGFH